MFKWEPTVEDEPAEIPDEREEESEDESIFKDIIQTTSHDQTQEATPTKILHWSILKLMEIEHNYDGYEILINKPQVKVYWKDDPEHPSIPSLRVELETFKVFPDQIFNLFDDEHICNQKNWNY